MERINAPLLFLCAFTLVSCVQQKEENKLFSINKKSQDEIMLIIEQETSAYVNRDSTLLISFYTDDEVTQSVWNNAEGSYGVLKGFKNIKQSFNTNFKNNPERLHLPDVERNEWYFKSLSEDWIWVNFVQKLKLSDGKIYGSYETRLMKKENGVWKIAVMYALSDHGQSEDKD